MFDKTNAKCGEFRLKAGIVSSVAQCVYEETGFDWLRDAVRRTILDEMCQFSECRHVELGHTPNVVTDILCDLVVKGNLPPDICARDLLERLTERDLGKAEADDEYNDQLFLEYWNYSDKEFNYAKHKGKGVSLTAKVVGEYMKVPRSARETLTCPAHSVYTTLRYTKSRFLDACEMVGDPTNPVEDQVAYFLLNHMKLPIHVAAGIMANIQRDSGFRELTASETGLIRWNSRCMKLIEKNNFHDFLEMETEFPGTRFHIVSELVIMEQLMQTDFEEWFDNLMRDSNTPERARSAASCWYSLTSDTYKQTESMTRQNLATEIYQVMEARNSDGIEC